MRFFFNKTYEERLNASFRTGGDVRYAVSGIPKIYNKRHFTFTKIKIKS